MRFLEKTDYRENRKRFIEKRDFKLFVSNGSVNTLSTYEASSYLG